VVVAVNGSFNYLFAGTVFQKLAPVRGLPFGAYAGEISKEHLVIGPITIGEDSIGSLFSKFGKSDVAKDDAGAPALICYTSNKEATPITVVFEAWGKARESEIIGFTLLLGKKKNVKSGKVIAKCSNSALVNHGLMTKSGMRMGLGVNEFKKILGEPLQETPSEIYYAYSNRRSVPVGEQATLPKQANSVPLQYDVLSTVEILKQKERVISISIRKTETF